MEKSNTALYGGLDLHGDNTYCALLDTNKNIVFERKLPNNLEAICQALEPHKQRIKSLAVESTFNWYWLVDGLVDQGYAVHLANPALIELNKGKKHANDKTDARHLAKLLLLGELPTGYVYPRETRGVRDLMRRRGRLVQDRTTEHQRLTGLCARQTGQELSARKILAAAAETPPRLAELLNHHAPSLLMAESSIRHIDHLNTEIKALEKTILNDLPDLDAYALLQTVPGIGPVLARCILLETGPIERFPSAGDYASYCRAVPAEHTSNGKKKDDGNTKCGNRHLAWAFVEAANFAVRFSPEINAWFQRKLTRSRNLRVLAVKALANKLAKSCHFILRDRKPFNLALLLGGTPAK